MLQVWAGSLCARGADRPSGMVTRAWSADQGLEAGLIFSMAQTSDGYLWLGTEHGLLRFDGMQFQPVPLTGMPAGSPVLELLADRSGALWIRTPGAKLLRWAPGSQAAEPVAFLRADAVLAMAPATRGGVVVSSASHDVLRIDGSTVENYGTKGPSLIIASAQADDSSLWLGTRGVGLYRWSSGALLRVGENTIDNKVNRLLLGRGGRLWVGTDRGLFLWDGKKAIEVQLTATEPLQVLSLIEDDTGELWIGTPQGLLRLTEDDAKAGATWVRHGGQAVTALLLDREGDIWFGDGSTLKRLQQSAVVPVDVPATVVRNGVGAIAADDRGSVWFAPLDRGLYWISGSTFHKIESGGLGRDVVYSIDCHGEDVWLGRRHGGLTRLHAHREGFAAQTWDAKTGMPSSIYAVRALNDGTVWAGSLTGGVSRLANGRVTHFGPASTGSDTVTAIERTRDGSVWFATPDGLTRYRDGVWQRGVAAAELPSQEVLSLFAEDGTLLVGTSRGAAAIDIATGRVTVVAPATHDPVLGLVVGGYGRLWISTTDQLLSTVLPTAATARVRSYERRDGLVTPKGIRRTRSLIADAHGNVFIATESGLARIRSSPEPRFVPALAHVRSVLADESLVPATKPTLIPANTRRTTLNFDALDLRAPEQVRLRYKLEGFDSGWSEPTVAHQASYTNLGPGKYVFHLLAQNSRGEWAEAATSLPIQVEPTLFQRWWFQMASCGLLLMAGVLLYRSRMRAVLRQATVLADERIAERNRIARDLHDTLLQGFISVMMHLHVTSERVPESSKTRNALHEILGMMEHVIEEARLSVQGLRSSETETPDLETALGAAGRTLGAGSLTMYEFRVLGQKRPVHPVVAEEVGRIATEAIRNAFRHAHASRLEVVLDYSRTWLKLRICDDGDGVEPATLAHGKEGHWGIRGMRERAKHIGAQLDIRSGAETGTVVVLTVAARVAFR